jgi:hypothetical protein
MTDVIFKEVDTEEPARHWEFIKCAGQVTLDLGCGRWERVEHRDQSWPTTPEYLVQLGAKEVHAYDADDVETQWYRENVSPNMPVFPYTVMFHTVDQLREVLTKHSPTVVKCDIEGAERLFLQLSDEEFTRVKFYAVEVHSVELLRAFTEKFTSLGYNIIANIALVHAPPMVAIFAELV